MIRGFLNLLKHDLRLQMRNRVEGASLILFFVIIVVLFPFTLGPEPDLLRRLAPGLIWLAAALMSLLSIDRLFVQDARDGTLDLMMVSPVPLPLVVLSKLAVQTATMLCALLVMLLPASLLLGMTITLVPMLALTLVLGVPILMLIGGVMAAITIALRRGAALLTLLLVPFYIPVIIFAVGACDAASQGIPAQSNLLLLGALLAILLPTVPSIVASAIRQD